MVEIIYEDDLSQIFTGDVLLEIIYFIGLYNFENKLDKKNNYIFFLKGEISKRLSNKLNLKIREYFFLFRKKIRDLNENTTKILSLIILK